MPLPALAPFARLTGEARREVAEALAARYHAGASIRELSRGDRLFHRQGARAVDHRGGDLPQSWRPAPAPRTGDLRAPPSLGVGGWPARTVRGESGGDPARTVQAWTRDRRGFGREP